MTGIKPEYALADLLQIRIGTPMGRITGHKRLKWKLGLWEIDADVMVNHVFKTDQALGVTVHLRRRLWAYIMVANNLDHTQEILMFLYDSSVIPSVVGPGSANSTLTLIEPAIVAAYEFKDQEWSPSVIADMVARYIKGRPHGARNSHKDRSKSPA